MRIVRIGDVPDKLTFLTNGGKAQKSGEGVVKCGTPFNNSVTADREPLGGRVESLIMDWGRGRGAGSDQGNCSK
jgi:hypothetical protein